MGASSTSEKNSKKLNLLEPNDFTLSKPQFILFEDKDATSCSTLAVGDLKFEFGNLWVLHTLPDTIKIQVIGVAGVGCSTAVAHFMNWEKTVRPNEVSVKQVEIDGHAFRVELIDVGHGEVDYNPMKEPTDRWDSGFMILFALNSRYSFENAIEKIKDIASRRNQKPEACPFVLVGAKADLPAEERKVTKREATLAALEFNLKYFEISADNNYGISEAFHSMIIEAIFNQPRVSIYKSPIPLARPNVTFLECQFLVDEHKLKTFIDLTSDTPIRILPSCPIKIIPVPVFASEIAKIPSMKFPSFGKHDIPLLVGYGRIFLSIYQKRSELKFDLPLTVLQKVFSFMEADPVGKINFSQANQFLFLHFSEDKMIERFTFGMELQHFDFEIAPLELPSATRKILKKSNIRYIEVASLCALLEAIAEGMRHIKQHKA